MKRLKVITGYTKDAQFWSEAGEVIGYLPRQTDIPSPYAYSPTDIVYDWNDKPIIHREVKHRRYEIFLVPPYTKIYTKENDAMQAFLKR